MNSSFLYHAWGLYSLECTKEEYKGNKIIQHVQSKKRLSVCPKSGKSHLVKNGYRFRDFIGLPGHYFIHAGTSGPVTVPHRLINSEHFSRFVFQKQEFFSINAH